MELEWTTRKRRIDARLHSLGWPLIRFRRGSDVSEISRGAVVEFPTAHGPADYALVVDGRVVGIIEAKRLNVDPADVLSQAERYARGLSDTGFCIEGIKAPFLWSSNGEEFHFRDARHPLNAARGVAGFLTPGAVCEQLARNFEAATASLVASPNTHPLLRNYQRDANRAVEEAILSRKREVLLAMATGTGKTFTIVNQVFRLLRHSVARRVLFLVDRRALAAQAVQAFNAFRPDGSTKLSDIYEVYSQQFHRGDLDGDNDGKFDSRALPTEYLTAPGPQHTFVYVCTVQRMAMNLFGREIAFKAREGDAPGDGESFDQDATDVMDIPIHAFDVVIADECHRGYTANEISVWRNTLNHFDAIRIGLTATPAAHTMAYFKDKVFEYGYRQAVADGFLVDYDAVKVDSGVRVRGVFLSEGEAVQYVDPKSGKKVLDRLEDERQFDASAVEREITVPDSNRKIIEEIKKYADEHEQRTGRFPKTLIFAVNDHPFTSHAQTVVEHCRRVFGRGDDFVSKITGTVDRPLQRIREFRNLPKPGIVVSVDLMATGVDIPDLEYIVFLRPVKSRILFEQMLGRGTRLGFNHKDKSHFVVFDCFGGTLLEYFREASDFADDAPQRSTKAIAELIDDIWSNRDRAFATRCLVKRLHRIDKEMSAKAREQFAAYLDDGDVGGFAKTLTQSLEDEFAKTIALLRDKTFQDLLVNYERAPKVFLVAEAQTDTVSSEWLIRDGQGKEYKPEEYLAAFARFVKNNPAKIGAIEILLKKPTDWSAQALQELRQKLAASQERFSIENLQRAHEVAYRRALVDVISMVKHAADDQQPLLTAQERVERAIAALTAHLTAPLSPQQQQWLDRIKAHLVQNLSIDQADFDAIPIFRDRGGWRAADRVFDGRLTVIVKELNANLAA
jgi:type I restriction enzyme R subunit